MAKELSFDLDAKKKLLAGIKKVSRAVSSTLGPKGNNVAIERKWGSPSVIHDGVSVAKEIDLVDKYENMGAQLIKEAAQKTNDKAGDGTTTATILTEAIVEECLKAIGSGANPMMIRKGIELAVDSAIKHLDEMSKKIENNESIKNIATISAQDEEIGNIIAKAIEKLGQGAIIAVEEGKSNNINVEYKEGFSFDKGYIAPHFINNEKTQEAIIENPYILITDMKINSPIDFNQFFQKFFNTEKPGPAGGLVVIADEISGNPLATMILNKVQNNLPIVAIEAPTFGGKKEELLKDMAFATGGVVFSKSTGSLLKNAKIEDLGRAEKMIVSKNSTIIVKGEGNIKDIKDRVASIDEQIKTSESEFETEKLEERKAKLTSGMAVINVGSNSEMETKEKKERCIDAVSATKAAIEDGIVPGGEIALFETGVRLRRMFDSPSEDIKIGWGIVSKATLEPFKRLMSNSGYDAGQMLEKLNNSKKVENAGVNVISGKIEDMIKSGIIDPVKVTKSALSHASSTAIMIMTTNTLIVESEQGKEKSTDAS